MWLVNKFVIFQFQDALVKGRVIEQLNEHWYVVETTPWPESKPTKVIRRNIYSLANMINGSVFDTEEELQAAVDEILEWDREFEEELDQEGVIPEGFPSVLHFGPFRPN